MLHLLLKCADLVMVAKMMSELCYLYQVLFCSVSGDIFPKEAEQKRADLGLQHSIDAKDTYLQRLLAAVIPSITPPEAVLHKAAANSEGELLDSCKYGLFESHLQ